MPLLSKTNIIYFLGFLILPLFYSSLFREIYIFPKWILLYIIFLLIILQPIFYRTTFKYPKLPYKLNLLSSLFILYIIIKLIYHNIFLVNPYVLDRVIFVFLIIFFFNISSFRKNKILLDILPPLLIAITVVLGVSFFQLLTEIKLIPRESNTSFSILSSFFGHINMASEFVGFCIITLLCIYKDIKKKALKFYIILIISFSLSFLYFSMCRSVYIGVFLSALYLICSKKSIRILTFIKISVLSILIIFNIQNYLITNKITFKSWINKSTIIHKDNTNKVLIDKKGSLNTRLNLITSSIYSIINNPMGFGPGRFQFNIVPFSSSLDNSEIRENWTQTSPHNSFLRWATEDGIDIVLLGALLFIFFLYSFKNKIILQIRNNKEFNYLIAISIYLFVDMLFQFPFEMSFCFFVTAFTTGHLLYSITKDNIKEKTITPAFQKALLLVSIIFITASYNIIWSRHIEYTSSHDFKKIQYACKIYPFNHRACLSLTNHHIKRGELDKAKKIISSSLKDIPNNFLFIEKLAWTHKLNGDFKQECKQLYKYDKIFSHKSSKNILLRTHCSKYIKNPSLFTAY
jgi:hypothetical protein